MIKFQAHKVVNTETGKTARVSYHHSTLINGRECVTVYAKDYGHALSAVFDGHAEYNNDTDMMTDYFEHGRVRFYPGESLYPAALARAQENAAKWEAKYAKRCAA